MRYPFPETPITVLQIQHYLRRYGLDCDMNSREIMEEIESHFGYRIKIANLILACLWTGYGVVPREGGNVFQFVEFEA